MNQSGEPGHADRIPASLISFRYYLHLDGAKPLGYLGVFTGLNLAGLAVLTSLALCLSL